MNKFVVFASVFGVLVAVSAVLGAPAPQVDAGPRSSAQDVQTVRYYSENNGLDGYKFT